MKEGAPPQAAASPLSHFNRLHVYQIAPRVPGGKVLVVGFNQSTQRCSVLKIQRSSGPRLEVSEDPVTYTCKECDDILAQVHEGSQALGGLRLLAEAHAILGSVRFLDCWHLLLVTRKAQAAALCGHKVYRVEGVQLVAVTQPSPSLGAAEAANEKRYIKLFMGLDLTKNFYFSHTYNLAASLQANCCGGAAAPGAALYEHHHVWNGHLSRPLREAVHDGGRWVVPLIHGFLEQRCLSVFGRQLAVTLVARRSRHFAGTRYRKRGLNDQGRVANEVETEQILDAGPAWQRKGGGGGGASGAVAAPGPRRPQRHSLLSSVVQLRGSVPLFWSQQLTTLSPKPEVALQNFDPLYKVTGLHFDDLRARYGGPLVVLNLLKSMERKRPRETLLSAELTAAIEMLNKQEPPERQVVYVPWDLNRHVKASGQGLLQDISTVVNAVLDATGCFVSGGSAGGRNSSRVLQPAAVATACSSSSSAEGPAANELWGCGLQCSEEANAWPPAPLLMPPPLDSVGQAAAAAAGASTTCSSPLAAASLELGAETPKSQLGADAGSAEEAALVAQALQRLRRFRPASGPPAAPSGAAAEAAAPRDHACAALAGAPVGAPRQLQAGVLRTNCIDCLDRTNVAQFAFGLLAFGRQLHALGATDEPQVDSQSSAALALMEMYEAMGNTLAMQYGGSEAHSVFFQRQRGQWEASTASKDLYTSLRRYYSNTYTDAEKQDAINLFLGNFVPEPGPGKPCIWDLDSDYYLHSDPLAIYGGMQALRAAGSNGSDSGSPALAALMQAQLRLAGGGGGGGYGAPEASAAAAALALQQHQPLLADAALASSASSLLAAAAAAHHDEYHCGYSSDESVEFELGTEGGEGGAQAGSEAGAEGGRGGGSSASSAAAVVAAGWGQMLALFNRPAKEGPLQLAGVLDEPRRLQSFDALLSKKPARRVAVRLFGQSTDRQSTAMWQAVQHAFSYFWAVPPPPQAAAAAVAPPEAAAKQAGAANASAPALNSTASSEQPGHAQPPAPQHAAGSALRTTLSDRSLPLSEESAGPSVSAELAAARCSASAYFRTTDPTAAWANATEQSQGHAFQLRPAVRQQYKQQLAFSEVMDGDAGADVAKLDLPGDVGPMWVVGGDQPAAAVLSAAAANPAGELEGPWDDAAYLAACQQWQQAEAHIRQAYHEHLSAALQPVDAQADTYRHLYPVYEALQVVS